MSGREGVPAPAPTAAGAPGAGAAATSANRFGRTSELRLRADARDGRTRVPEVFCTQPFKVMHPFPVDASELPGLTRSDGSAAPLQVMVMAVSAGIMAGDDQLIDVAVDEGAALQVTTQSFEKVHRMGEGESARRTQRLSVARGALLDYSPLPQIPFAGSSFASDTAVELADRTSRLVYSEIISCGRAARGERFAYRSYRNRVRIGVAGEPVFIDNTVYEPAGSVFDGAPVDMQRMGFYEGFSHLANLVFVNLDIDEGRFEAAREYLGAQTGVIGASSAPVSRAGGSEAVDLDDSESVAGGITRLGSGDVAVKLLGHRAQRLQEVLSGVRRLVS